MEDKDYIALSLEQQQLVTTEQAWHYHIVPKQNGEKLHLYTDDSGQADSEELEMLFGKTVVLEEENADVIRKTLSTYYRRERSNTADQLTYSGDSKDFIKTLISEAKALDSSDIHIETYDERCRVRIRIDGKLVERYTIEKRDYPAIVNKVKIMANLDIAEKRLPQDGRIFFEDGGKKFDIRVSVLPTLHGEKLVLRLLSNDATNIDINQLGFGEKDLHNYLEAVKKPHGIILISGPTGSGKTTTLYATLKILNETTRNILTIEDPIEYTLEGINQVQLKENIGMNFNTALKSFLRQDPDVIMLGEIRDADTAAMAIRFSLTGHLVLSTIHTNSAWDIITRLVDMGVPSYLVANTMSMAVAQRLVRKLCPHCKKKSSFDPKLFPGKFKPYKNIAHHYEPVGCDECFYTGYKGRIAIYEVIPIDPELGENIKLGHFEVNELLKERGIETLAENAFHLFDKGETSLEEIYPLLLNF